MSERLRVDTAAVHTVASGWHGLVSELNGSAPSAQLGLSCQPSAAAVVAAHGDAAAFVHALAMQVRDHATQVVEAGRSYLSNEANSADELGAVDV